MKLESRKLVIFLQVLFYLSCSPLLCMAAESNKVVAKEQKKGAIDTAYRFLHRQRYKAALSIVTAAALLYVFKDRLFSEEENQVAGEQEVISPPEDDDKNCNQTPDADEYLEQLKNAESFKKHLAQDFKPLREGKFIDGQASYTYKFKPADIEITKIDADKSSVNVDVLLDLKYRVKHPTLITSQQFSLRNEVISLTLSGEKAASEHHNQTSTNMRDAVSAFILREISSATKELIIKNFEMQLDAVRLGLTVKCKICNKVERKMQYIATPCGHTFHRSCIHSKLENTPTCPTCDAALKAEDLIVLRAGGVE